MGRLWAIGMTPAAAPTTTDWITAIATVFAATGTVGAVIVALQQIRRQERRHLTVHCRPAVAAPDPATAVQLVTLRATNDGLRPVKISQAYVQTDASTKVFARLTSWSASLPILVLPGESIEVSWARDDLEQTKKREGFHRYLFAFFEDTVGHIYPAPYPGIEQRPRGPPWKRRDEWLPQSTRA